MKPTVWMCIWDMPARLGKSCMRSCQVMQRWACTSLAAKKVNNTASDAFQVYGFPPHDMRHHPVVTALSAACAPERSYVLYVLLAMAGAPARIRIDCLANAERWPWIRASRLTCPLICLEHVSDSCTQVRGRRHSVHVVQIRAQTWESPSGRAPCLGSCIASSTSSGVGPLGPSFECLSIARFCTHFC